MAQQKQRLKMHEINEVKAKILSMGHKELVKIHKMIGDTIERNREDQQRLRSELIITIEDIKGGHKTIFTQSEIESIADKMIRCTGYDLRKQSYWGAIDQIQGKEQELFKQILDDPNGFDFN